MINVISLLGMQNLQDALAKKLERSGIKFVCNDCTNEVILLTEFEHYAAEADVVLINSGVLHMKSIEGILNDLRELSQEIRIILILNGSRKQFVSAQLDEYRNHYMVSDIIFEGNGIDIEEMANAMLKGRMTENEILVQAELTKEYMKIQTDSNSHTIAVFGITRGAGTTNMVITLSEYFALYNKTVKAVDLTGTSSLAFADGKAIYLTQKRQNLKEVKRTSDFVIYDFGVPFLLNAQGDFQGIAPDYTPDLIYELKCCHLKVCLCFLDNWHVKKVEYFWRNDKWKQMIQNDYVFLFDRDPAPLKKMYPSVNMFERNDQSFADIIAKLFLNGDD